MYSKSVKYISLALDFATCGSTHSRFVGEGEEDAAEGEEEPTEGVEEATEGEGGSTAAATLGGRLERPLRQLPAGESTEGEKEPTEGVEVPPKWKQLCNQGGEQTVARRSG